MPVLHLSSSDARRLLKRVSGQVASVLDAMPKGHKYYATRTILDGEAFHSQGEATRYAWLKLRQRLGEIRGLARTTAFELHGCNLLTGELVVIGEYQCDFDYIDTKTGERVVEDWKGGETLPIAKWKMRHLKAEYGITVLENRKRPLVKRGRRR